MNRVARILIDSRSATSTFNTEWTEKYGIPPHRGHKVQRFRGEIYVRVHDDADLILADRYQDMGYVQISDADGNNIVLRGHNRMSREVRKLGLQEGLFDLSDYVTTSAVLIVATFRKGYLDLLGAAAAEVLETGRLVPIEVPAPIGTWGVIDDATFDQEEESDPFGDLLDDEDVDEEDEGGVDY